jgi:hypothetical protein
MKKKLPNGMYTEATNHKKHYQCELRLRFMWYNIKELEEYSYQKNMTLSDEMKIGINKVKTEINLYFDRYKKGDDFRKS